MTATWYRSGDKVLVVCPKAGSTSIREVMKKEIQPHAITPKDRVIWFARHPIERIESCFNHFSETGWPNKLVFNSIQGFVDAILQGVSNRHWSPQTPQVSYPYTFLPTEVYKFEHIDTLWPKLFSKPLPHMNPSTKEVKLDYRISELERLYQDDLAHWEDATAPLESVSYS